MVFRKLAWLGDSKRLRFQAVSLFVTRPKEIWSFSSWLLLIFHLFLWKGFPIDGMFCHCFVQSAQQYTAWKFWESVVDDVDAVNVLFNLRNGVNKRLWNKFYLNLCWIHLSAGARLRWISMVTTQPIRTMPKNGCTFCHNMAWPKNAS